MALAVAFYADCGHKVLDPEHIVCEFLVDQRRVGEGEEYTVAVLFTQPDQVFLADERFAAGVDVEVYAHFLALTDDVVDLVKRKV